MDILEQQELLNTVADSLRRAESKNPAFASMISRRPVVPGHLESYRDELTLELERVRMGNKARESVGHGSIEDLLHGEILEALDAFYRGDHNGAKREFVQVAVIAVRAIDWVDKFSAEHRFREKHKRGSDVK